MAIQITGSGGQVRIDRAEPNTLDQTDPAPRSGLGTAAAQGVVPDAVTQQPAAYTSMLAGLASFAPEMDMADFETRLAEVAGKLQEARGDANLDRLRNEQELKKQQIEENRELLATSQDKMGNSEVARNGSRVSSGVGAVLQGIGAGAMILAGAVLTALPGGVTQVAGVALIVAGGFMMASAINSGVSAATENGMGIAGSLATLFGADAQTAQSVDMAAMITLAVGTLAAMAVAVVASGGGASPAFAAVMSGTIGMASSIAGGAGMLTSAAGNAVATGFAVDAANSQAELQDQQAGMQQIDDRVDQLLSFVASSNEQFNAMIDALTEMAQETAASLSSARFVG